MQNEFNNPGNKLIAKWRPGQDSAFDDPAEIHWEDGRSAIMEDYVRRLDDTHENRIVEGKPVRTIFPGVVAHLRFDKDISRWVCEPPDQPRTIMELSDRDIDDDQVIAELYTYPIVYRVVIHRD